MLRFLAGKVTRGVVTLLIAVSAAFFLARGTGDPVREMLGDLAGPEQVAQLSAQLGLDRPLPVQYAAFVGDLATGDLGTSIRYGTPNLDLILGWLPASLQLAAAAMVLAVLVGIPLGVWAALREGRFADRFASTVALTGQSIPLFWLGLMLILLFAVTLGWLPAGQSTGFSSLILPAVTLSTLPMAQIARLTRSSMSEVLGEAFLDATRARGVARWRVVLVHALRNAALPVITIIGLQTGTLLSGAITVEFVFAWPGLGTLATQAVQMRDFSLIQAIVIFGAVVFVLVNLIVDLLYGILDPRIRDGVA
ncbi:peptide ABC transporter permease [Sphaerisporangium rufum]|uniref:Peptide ABC transporter permease n=1 Tax=Sphaerisporangium rufum TaxID=1381558 RepID=A0A919R2M7_9ACTN|nr:ABC transporter permease [Sphaerisporangium rufum]GII78542.1 peptide ABC transporter permease [Sphaerisporangium rufum]